MICDMLETENLLQNHTHITQNPLYNPAIQKVIRVLLPSGRG